MNPLTAAVPLPGPIKRFAWVFSDRVLISIILGFAILAVIDNPQAGESLRFTATSFISIIPFILAAIAVTGYTKATGADKIIARLLSGRPVFAIMAASLAGALSPFCSCGVIPLIAAMLASGVPLAPVMAFCIASPIMDPEMFILTAAGINFNFAVAKTFAATGMGLSSGFTVYALQKFGFLSNPVKGNQVCGCGCQKEIGPIQPNIIWRFWRDINRRSQFVQEALNSGRFLGRWLMFAFFLESLMIAYVPAEWIAGLVGGNSAFAIPLAALIGVPSYLNGYAAIPLISGLMDMGMTPGAAMAFITAGAVSSIPAALAVYALVRKPVFALYLLLGLTGSIIAGYAYQLVMGLAI